MSLFHRLFRLLQRLLPKESYSLLIISLLALISIVANWTHLAKYSEPGHPSSSSNCDSILKYGRFLTDVDETPSNWQPDGCVLKNYRSYHADRLQKCLQPGDEIFFFGDSTARQVFWGFTTILFQMNLPLKGAHHSMRVEKEGVVLNFIWDHFLDSDGANITASIAKHGLKAREKKKALALNKNKAYKPKTYIYTTVGPWYATTEKEDLIAQKYYSNIGRFLESLESQTQDAFAGVYLAPALTPAYPFLDARRTISMKPSKYRDMSTQSDKLFNYVRTNETVSSRTNPALYPGGVRYVKNSPLKSAAYYVPVFNEISAENHRGLYDHIGVHFTQTGFLTQANILLNHICNQKLSEESLIDAGTCCVSYVDRKGNFSLLGVIKKAAAFLPVLVLLYFVFNDLTLTLKYSLPVALILAAVATWAHVSNEAPVVSKIELLFSSAESLGMLQVWAAIVLISAAYSQPVISAPISAAVAELQGACVTLYLIVQYSGATILPTSFRGEASAHVLLSMWLLIQVYDFSRLCADNLDPTSLITSYSQLITPSSKAFARALALPLLLSVSVTNISRDFPPNSTAPSYSLVATKVSFATAFVFAILPLVSLLTSKVEQLLSSLKDDNSATPKWVANTLVRYPPAGQALAQAAVLFSLSTIFYALASLFLSVQLPGVLAQALSTIGVDYWTVVFGIWIALLQRSIPYNGLIKVSVTSVIFATAIAIGLVNTVRSYIGFYLPEDPFEINTPSSYVQVYRTLYGELITVRGAAYTPAIHLFLVLALLACYIVIRLGLMQLISPAGPIFSPVLIAASEASYEMLLLYPYTLLAVGGTVRLHYLPTGIVHSSLVTRNFNFVNNSFKFPYTWWHNVEKIRKAVSMAIGAGVLWALASVSASIWTNIWPINEPPSPPQNDQLPVSEEQKMESFDQTVVV